MKPVWERLIRFVAADGKVLHGEPLATASNLDLGLVTEKSGLKAKVIEGSDLFDTSGETRVTDTIVDVKQILGPLTRADVPVIRCIGLNYAKHSTCGSFPKSNEVRVTSAERRTSGEQATLAAVFRNWSFLTSYGIVLIK
jgi:hypothetical protein